MNTANMTDEEFIARREPARVKIGEWIAKKDFAASWKLAVKYNLKDLYFSLTGAGQE